MVNSKDQWKAWLYLSPAIVLLLIFTVWPIINTVRMSLLEGYSGLKAASGASFEFGLGNFVKVIKYRKFLTCLQNTVLLCLWTVPISTILALLIAVALNSIKVLQKALQTIFFLPYVTNSIAIGMVFAAMFNIVGSFYGTENEIVVTAGIINNIIENRRKGKKHHIIVNAEGIGHSTSMARRIEAATGIETRATILGHMQRGGSPTCKDRVYASIMGAYAVDLLLEGKTDRVVAYKNGEYVDYDIDEALSMTKTLPEYQWEIARALSYNYTK